MMMNNGQQMMMNNGQ